MNSDVFFTESGESEPRTKQSLWYRWMELGHWSLAACCSCHAWIVVPSPENSLESAFPSHSIQSSLFLNITWQQSCHREPGCTRHLQTSVLVIILQFSSCREAAVETAGNWLIAAETAAGSYCLAGAEFALAFGSSHGEPLISQTYQGPNHSSLQPPLSSSQFDAKLLWLWERPLTALPGKLQQRRLGLFIFAIYDTIRNLLRMQSTSRLWMVNANYQGLSRHHKIWR